MDLRSNKIYKTFGDIWSVFIHAYIRNNKLPIFPIPEDGETLANTGDAWVFMEYTMSRFVDDQ